MKSKTLTKIILSSVLTLTACGNKSEEVGVVSTKFNKKIYITPLNEQTFGRVIEFGPMIYALMPSEVEQVCSVYVFLNPGDTIKFHNPRHERFVELVGYRDGVLGAWPQSVIKSVNGMRPDKFVKQRAMERQK